MFAVVPARGFEFPFQVDLGANAHDFVIDATRGVIHASLPGENAIVTVPLDRLRVDSRTVVGSVPRGLDVDPDGAALYVALNGSGSVAVVDPDQGLLTDTLDIGSELRHPSTWDVVAPAPGLLFVSANPSSGGLAHLVRVETGPSLTATRVADNRFIRAAPSLELSRDRQFLYVGEGFSPNSLYKLDLGSPTAPVIAEDDHGTVSGTSIIEPSPEGGRVHLGSGQILDAGSLDVLASLVSGVPRFARTQPNTLYIAMGSVEPDAFSLREYNASTLAQTGSRTLACTTGSSVAPQRFRIAPDDSAFVMLNGDHLCGQLILPDLDAGYLHFASTAASAPEAAGSVSVSVCRAGGDTGSVSAAVSAIDDTAQAGTHYTMPATPVVFADGESGCKPFSIGLVDNGEPDAVDRRFRLNLTPSGGAGRIQWEAQLTIEEDDPAPVVASPVVSAQAALTVAGHQLVHDARRERLYVSLPGENRLVAISATSFEIVDSLELSHPPRGIALSLDGNRLFVALNGAGAVAAVDLDLWAVADTYNLSVELGDARTWDVVEASPGVLFVTSNPGSGGFAYVVRADINQGVIAARVANQRIIRASPTLALSEDGLDLFVGTGFSPNSLYRLDLSTPSAPIAAEDDHGSVSGTNRLSVNSAGTFIAIGSGQVLRTADITQAGLTAPGTPGFAPQSPIVYVAPTLTGTIRAFDTDLFIEAASYPLACPQTAGTTLDFLVLPDDAGFVTLTTVGLCAAITPTRGYLYLQQSSYAVAESAGMVGVGVCRAGATGGAVSALMATGASLAPTFDDAVPGEDFTPIAATEVSFGDGEGGCKTLPVTILDDSLLQGARQFEVRLEGATGGAVIAREMAGSNGFTLTGEAAATVVIEEDEPDVGISIDAATDSLLAGEVVELTITAGNLSAANPGAVVIVALEIPAGVEFLGVTQGGLACTGTTSLSCDAGTIAGGQSTSFSVAVRPMEGGETELIASLVGPGPDLDAGNDQAVQRLSVEALPTAWELLPLIPGTQWVYRDVPPFAHTQTVIGPVDRFPGWSAHGIVQSAQNSVSYYTQQDGLHQHGIAYDNGDQLLRYPPVKLLNAQPRIGDVISSAGQFEYTLEGIGVLSFPYTATATLVDWTDLYISVALGTRRVAIVEVDLQVSGTSDGLLIDASLHSVMYLAKGIGRLTEVNTFVDRLSQDESTEVLQMLSYTFPDTDGDGLTDDQEIIAGLAWEDADSDNDGLDDGDEVNVHMTDPLNPDSDADGVPDGIELAAGSNPLDAASRPAPSQQKVPLLPWPGTLLLGLLLLLGATRRLAARHI